MNDAARAGIAEAFRQDAMAEAHEQMLWRGFIEADRVARETLDIRDGRFAQKAYSRFLRLSLTEPERQVVELEDRVRLLEAELATLKAARQRPKIPVPQWRDPPALPNPEDDR